MTAFETESKPPKCSACLTYDVAATVNSSAPPRSTCGWPVPADGRSETGCSFHVEGTRGALEGTWSSKIPTLEVTRLAACSTSGRTLAGSTAFTPRALQAVPAAWAWPQGRRDLIEDCYWQISRIISSFAVSQACLEFKSAQSLRLHGRLNVMHNVKGSRSNTAETSERHSTPHQDGCPETVCCRDWMC